MDILVNISSFQPPITGIGRYTARLLNYLSVENNVQAFDPLKSYTDIQLKEKLKFLDKVSESRQKKDGISYQLRKMLRNIPCSYQLRQFVQQQISQQQFKRCEGYIYWEPNYILQPFNGLSVATIHDLSFIKYPQYHSSAMLAWLDKNLESSINRADALVTVSEFSKKELLKQFSIPESKITIVSPSVANEFKTSASKESVEKIKQKYGLPKHYILSVGTLEPRKNLTTLLNAYARLPKRLKQSYPLVLVGAKGWGNIQNIIQPMVNSGDVIMLGYIKQQDIPIIYKGSSLFICLSLYEGYGMPVAEAMASGVAVLTSENSAMSEVSGKAAKLVNPLDVEQITDSMQYYLQEEEARKQLAEKGRIQMQDRNWKNSADKLIKLFQEIKSTSSK